MSNNQNSLENERFISDIYWIDEKVNNNENKKNQTKLKNAFSDKNFKLIAIENFDTGFNEILKVKFKFIYLIISGRNFKKYVEYVDKYKNELTTIPITIIFTSKEYQVYLYGKKEDKNYKLDKKITNAVKDHDPLYNIGGIAISINQIIDFINDFETNLNEGYEDVINFKRDYKSALIFERIYSIENLILPSLYKQIEIQNLDIFKTDIDKMNSHILSNYKKKDIKKILLPLKKFNINIPPEIMSKIWIYIYSCESDFYKDMNVNLMTQKDIELYNSFIKMLYKGLEIKSLKINCTDDLYRCCFIKKEEIQKLEEIIYIPPTEEIKENDKIDVYLIYSRSFLSFSKDKEKALNFLRENTNNELVSCIFVVNGLRGVEEENEFYSSNADIEEISRFPGEKEVLFFPFSSFIITDIEDDEVEKNNQKIKVKRITLEYLGKFKKQINKIIQKINIAKLLEEQKKSQFLQEIKEIMQKHLEEEETKKRKKNKIKKPEEKNKEDENEIMMEHPEFNTDQNFNLDIPIQSVNKIKQIINEKIENVIEEKKYQLNINTFKKDRFIEFKSEPNTLKFEKELDIDCFSDYSDNQFCLFTSTNKENLLVYIKGENKNSLGCYNLKTTENKTINNVHKENILCIKHYTKNKEDLIITTSYDNSLKILNITKEWECIHHIKDIGQNEGINNNYYLYSASLLTIENEKDDIQNKDYIIVTCYNDDDIKIYEYETEKKVEKKFQSKCGFIFLDTYYDEFLKKNFIICSNYIDSEFNNGKEEQFITIYDFETEEKYLNINNFAHNVIIRKIHNYNENDISNENLINNEENKSNENQINNEENKVSILFASNNKIYIYDFYNKIKLNEIEIKSVNYLHCICLWNKDYIIVGGEKKDNKIHIINLNQNKENSIEGYNVYTFAKIKEENKEKLYCQDLENQKFMIFKNDYNEEII